MTSGHREKERESEREWKRGVKHEYAVQPLFCAAVLRDVFPLSASGHAQTAHCVTQTI